MFGPSKISDADLGVLRGLNRSRKMTETSSSRLARRARRVAADDDTIFVSYFPRDRIILYSESRGETTINPPSISGFAIVPTVFVYVANSDSVTTWDDAVIWVLIPQFRQITGPNAAQLILYRVQNNTWSAEQSLAISAPYLGGVTETFGLSPHGVQTISCAANTSTRKIVLVRTMIGGLDSLLPSPINLGRPAAINVLVDRFTDDTAFQSSSGTASAEITSTAYQSETIVFNLSNNKSNQPRLLLQAAREGDRFFLDYGGLGLFLPINIWASQPSTTRLWFTLIQGSSVIEGEFAVDPFPDLDRNLMDNQIGYFDFDLTGDLYLFLWNRVELLDSKILIRRVVLSGGRLATVPEAEIEFPSQVDGSIFLSPQISRSEMPNLSLGLTP